MTQLLTKTFFRKSIFFSALLVCLATYGQAQISLTWKWESATVSGPPNGIIATNGTMNIDVVTASAGALTLTQQNKFLSETIITIEKNGQRRIDNKALATISPAVKFSGNTIEMSKFFGTLSEGETIKIIPSLGASSRTAALTIKVSNSAGSTTPVTPPQIETSVVYQTKEASEDQLEKFKQDQNKVNQQQEKRIAAVENKLTAANGKQETVSSSKLIEVINPTYAEDCKGCIDQDGDIIYDYACKKFILVKGAGAYLKYYYIKDLTAIKIKDQQVINMRVTNVNRYRFDIKVDVNGIDYQSDAPPLWNTYFSGSSSLATALANSVSALPTAGGTGVVSGGDSDNPTPQQKILNTLLTFEKDYNALLDLQLEAYLLCPDIKCCTDVARKKPAHTFSYFANSLNTVSAQILLLETTTLKGIPNAADLNTQIDAKIKANQQAADNCTQIDKDNAAKADLNKQIAALDATKDKDKIDKLKAQIVPLDVDLDKLKGTECDKAKRDKDLQQLKDALPLRQAVDLVKTGLPTIDDMRKIYLFDENIVKENFQYRLPPIYAQDDHITITVAVDSRDADLNAKSGFSPGEHTQTSLDLAVRNKWQFSFSTGPFYAFGWEHRGLASYSWQTIPASGNVIDQNARYKLIPSGNLANPFGLAAFANFGHHFRRYFGLNATVGAGVSIDENPAPSFMFGLTPSFGDDQRLNFTFGLATSQARIAKYSLYENNLYQTKPTIEYDKPFKMGVFFALSYQIFTKATVSKTSSKTQL